MSDTIAAIATGAAVSAIGIIRLSGENTISSVDRLFHPYSGRKISEEKNRRLVYGELYSTNGELIDVCMCTISRGPSSYTGEDTAEFQCHGSPMVLRTVLEELFRLGVRQAKPGEFTKRAFLNGRLELTSAEAVADLIDAETAEAAKNAAGQLSGAIGKKSTLVYSQLADICSHYHAVLDYPDEDIEPFIMGEYKNVLNDAVLQFERLLRTYSRGRHMRSGIPAAIIGKPNAGKSSLLNALLGYDRAIVTSMPGTTRDTIEERIRIGGVTLRLIDTAGIRDAENEAEKLGVQRSLAAAEDAELILAVIDGTAEYDEETEKILAVASKAQKSIAVLSKKDISNSCVDCSRFKIPTVSVSSVTGEGLDELENRVADLFPEPDVPAGEILTNSRQAEAISRALDFLKAALKAMEYGNTPDIVLTEVEGAMQAIGELNGQTVREDVTDRIFERFCVGK